MSQKNELIEAEISRLTGLFKKIDKSKLNAVKSLISNAAFMTITLKELQEEINEKGCISEYQNGENQWGTKKSPEVEVYNVMVKNLSSILKQLADFFPNTDDSEGKDELLDFIKRK